jgi:hypothetical protein
MLNRGEVEHALLDRRPPDCNEFSLRDNGHITLEGMRERQRKPDHGITLKSNIGGNDRG